MIKKTESSPFRDINNKHPVCDIRKHTEQQQKNENIALINKLDSISYLLSDGEQFFNEFFGYCYFTPSEKQRLKETMAGGIFGFGSCTKEQNVVNPVIRLPPTHLQIFYRNNGITLFDFLKKKREHKDHNLALYVKGILNITKAIKFLQDRQLMYNRITTNNIMMADTHYSQDQMLLINLNNIKVSQSLNNDSNFEHLGSVIKEILVSYEKSNNNGLTKEDIELYNIIYDTLTNLLTKSAKSAKLVEQDIDEEPETYESIRINIIIKELKRLEGYIIYGITDEDRKPKNNTRNNTKDNNTKDNTRKKIKRI